MNIVQVYRRFPTEESCVTYIEALRWSGYSVCPYCKSAKVSAVPIEQRHHCNACNTSFSVTVGTIFNRTHLDLRKWILAIWLILNTTKGISARQLARDLKVDKNTAWRITMQIRVAMDEPAQRDLLKGLVEAVELCLVGKPRRGIIGSGGHRGGDKKHKGRST